jgi:hypothetical protein
MTGEEQLVWLFSDGEEATSNIVQHSLPISGSTPLSLYGPFDNQHAVDLAVAYANVHYAISVAKFTTHANSSWEDRLLVIEVNEERRYSYSLRLFSSQ